MGYRKKHNKQPKNKKITKLIKEIKTYRRKLEDAYTSEEKEALWNSIIKNMDKILEIEPDNEIALGEKIKGYMYLQQIENAEIVSKELLEKNPKNVIALHYLSKIERNKGNLEKEKEYLERIIELSSEEEEPKATMRLARVKLILNEGQLYRATLGVQRRDEEQRKYAKEKMNENMFFTAEDQKDYINQKYKEFSEGKIQKKHLLDIIEELKRYPEQTTSMLFIVDLYSMITGDYQSSMNKLEQYKLKNKLPENEVNAVNEEIKKYSTILSFNERQEQVESEAKSQREKQIKEQRAYSKFILEKMKKGKIKREELPEIVKRLENYPDKARSIFLITKIYEIVDGRISALKMLAKYTMLKNLSYHERKIITDMQNTINYNMKYESSTTEELKTFYANKNEQIAKKHEQKVKKDTVIKYIEKGNSIGQIKELLANNGIVMTTTAIRKIRDTYAQKNENIKERILQIRVAAKNLLKNSYTPKQVYEFIGYDIPLKEIKQMENEKDDTELSH